jgi:hypothetical protein
VNVLPFVFAFFLIFAVGSYTFLQSLRATKEEQTHFSAAMRLHEDLNAHTQKKAYRSHLSTEEKKERKEKKIREEAVFYSPRENFPLPQSGKLNLTFLLKEENPLLKRTALDLLRRLYWNSPFYKENFEEEVLGSLLNALKENPNLTSFEQLLALLPTEERPFFYKLIKGTQHYVVGKTDSGYPPLGDFFRIEPAIKGKPINFATTSTHTLAALFGDRAAANILNREKEKWEVKHAQKILTKKELEPFLLHYNVNLANFTHLLAFTKPSNEKKGRLLKDDSTKVQFTVKN